MSSSNECVCRQCSKHYDNRKSRADYQGYCSMKCQHAKAKSLGYKKDGPRSEYRVLSDANVIGSVFAPGV